MMLMILHPQLLLSRMVVVVIAAAVALTSVAN
jgi:hypothetical protein